MKIFIVILLLLLGGQITSGQTYYVTYIKGKVRNTNKKDLKIGDVLKPQDKLYFADKVAKVTCISSEKGRYEISPGNNSKENSSSELVAVLKNKLIPLSGTYKLSSRSLNIESNNPSTYFSSKQTENKIVLILDQPITISSNYSLNGSNIFFLQFKHGNSQMLERLQKKEQSIWFTSENTKMILPDQIVDLCFATTINDRPNSSKITSFVPVFMSQDELLEQIKLFKILYPNDDLAMKTALTNHFYESIGKIDEAILKNYISKLK